MVISPSELRANIYRLLDQVLETGMPLEVERRGRTLLIVSTDVASKLERLSPRKGFIVGDPEDLVHVDWSGEWKP